ncbi:MAG: hypothetical protein EXR57_02825 [Dehalococcoidia bacterium]|nr:hypothetical protein [Dehalococcoidia bacterium]
MAARISSKQSPKSGSAQESNEPKYSIDFKAIEASRRSASFMIASRMCGRCAACAKLSKDGPAFNRPSRELMKHVVDNCALEPAFLLPNTPVTEAVFRLLLGSGNRPMTVPEILDGLNQAWASVMYLKNINDEVIRRMVDRPNEYFIRKVAKS